MIKQVNSTKEIQNYFNRHIDPFVIGFDHLWRDLTDQNLAGSSSYPPYNIEKVEQEDEEKYTLSLAIAGFSKEQISVVQEKNVLKIKNIPSKDEEEDPRNFVHRGIAGRNFKHNFKLDEHMKVIGVVLKDGILNIDLKRIVPEEEKPTEFEIK